MDESIHITRDLELTPSQSPADHFRQGLSEIFGGDNVAERSKFALPAALFGAFVGWRLLGSRIGRKAEEMVEESVAAKFNILKREEPLFSDNSFAPKYADLQKQSLDPSFRYFEQSRGLGSQLYRFPANGKNLYEQAHADVEVYKGFGRWSGNHKMRLVDEDLKGWFDEKQDELSLEDALKLMQNRGR